MHDWTGTSCPRSGHGTVVSDTRYRRTPGTPVRRATNVATSKLVTASARQSFEVEDVGTKPTPTSTPLATSSGRTGPSGRFSGLRRSGRLQPSEMSLEGRDAATLSNARPTDRDRASTPMSRRFDQRNLFPTIGSTLDQAQLSHIVTLAQQLVGRDLYSFFGEGVKLEALLHLPRTLGIGEDRKAEG